MSDVGEDIPEFSIAESSLSEGTEKESLVTSRSKGYEAFTVSGTRFFVADGRTGKIFEIQALPFSDLDG